MTREHRGRARLAAAVGAVLGAAVLATTTSAANQPLVRVTFVGDSVPASIHYSTIAQRALAAGMKVRLDLRVCRRLVSLGCPYQGVTPPNALQTITSYGPALGDVLIVDVGYNDGAAGYGRGIDQIMRTAGEHGVKGVVWVTLRETRYEYHLTNVAIRAAATRWTNLHVADWNRHSSGHAWFADDGLHLTATGAEALARFLRPFVVGAA